MISHSIEEGLGQADLVLGLRAGRPVLLERASVLDHDAVAEVFE